VAGAASSSAELIPVVGSVLGAVSLSSFGVAATYAIGKIVVRRFEAGGTIAAAEAVLNRLLETYALPPDQSKEPARNKEANDIPHDFTQSVRAEPIA
jgi:hypothetical protein